eukprot:TRINITY_DN31028_c0_g1_i1.p1 TRINITY_DN31028_c0_g1~~TRINITY_DN31028_c0_g1_i1.p1  ORF type:complete len:730 (-),score=129.17 TRINITY_DN31028_c0_g1_i1:41-2230(-)
MCPAHLLASLAAIVTLVAGITVEVPGDGAPLLRRERGRVVGDILEEPEEGQRHTYGPHRMRGRMIDYFKHWSRGKLTSLRSRTLKVVRSHLDASMLEMDSVVASSTTAEEALARTRAAECPHLIGGAAPLKLLEADRDSQLHLLLADAQGHLQYVALEPRLQPRTLAADPPACGAASLLQSQLLDTPPNLTYAARTVDTPKILSLDDPSVEDCRVLFTRTLAETCEGKQVELTVISASQEVISGFMVRMLVNVCPKGENDTDNCKHHRLECIFTFSKQHGQVSLLEQSDVSDQLPEEALGLHATVSLTVPLCEVDTREGILDISSNASSSNQSSLFQLLPLQRFGMGELSRYKGYEHINDQFPVWGALLEEDQASQPSDFDLRHNFSACFPDVPGDVYPHTEVIRDQGTCGSCWAFATASATAANLCLSSDGNDYVFNAVGDRAEVSVQNVMSCKPEGEPTQLGCKGGSFLHFHKIASSQGLLREKKNSYKCAGSLASGDFFLRSGQCEMFPWGGACSNSSECYWNWGGFATISTEHTMRYYLLKNMALVGTLDIYMNMFELKDGIYKETSGELKGGHAVTILGYGVSGATKYWTFQNSWGYDWGEGGYGKIVRGINMCGIEEKAMVVRAWVTGGKAPLCLDSTTGTGLMEDDGSIVSCSDARSYHGLDLCTHEVFGSLVSEACMKTCDKCEGVNGLTLGKSCPGLPFTAEVQSPGSAMEEQAASDMPT